MKALKLFLLLILIPNFTRADVIFAPYTDGGYWVALSLEVIGSYEIAFNKSNTIDFWGGAGLVSAFSRIVNPATGGELAFELRHYFKKEEFSGFNLGLYAGFAAMKAPEFYHDKLIGREISYGFVPGVKLTYKHRVNSWLAGEPYIGLSVQWYHRNFGELFDGRVYPSGPILTVGYRFGFNKVRRRMERRE